MAEVLTACVVDRVAQQIRITHLDDRTEVVPVTETCHVRINEVFQTLRSDGRAAERGTYRQHTGTEIHITDQDAAPPIDRLWLVPKHHAPLEKVADW